MEEAAKASLKKQRTTAKRNFTRKTNSLKALLKSEVGTPRVPIAEVNLCFDDLCNSWKTVEQKHDAYIDAVEEDDQQEQQWIQELEDSFVESRRCVVSYRETSESDYSRSSAKRSYDLQEKNYLDMCISLESLLSVESLPETLTNERLSTSSQLEKLKEVHNSYASIVSEDDMNQLSKKMANHIKTYNVLKLKVDRGIVEYKQQSLAKKTPFRMEKMPLPKFDGAIREYPQFKKDFHELVLPSVSSKESAYTLRQCLGREVSQYLGSCNNNVSLMFERLDLKYGDPSKVVDSILSEIIKFRKIEDGEYGKVIKFIDTVEMAHRDLEVMSLASELSNTNTVSLIENKLPNQMQMEWYRYMHKSSSPVDKKNKFPSLLKFLSAERNAIQYAMSDIRQTSQRSASGTVQAIVSSETTCVIHFWSDNHATTGCRSYNNLPVATRKDVLRERSACFGCLVSGHVIGDCNNRTECTANENCREFHHPSLHDTTADAPAEEALVTTLSGCRPNPDDGRVLLPIMKVVPNSSRCKYLSCLWDTAADVSLITFTKANQLRLRGQPGTLSITGAGGVKTFIDTYAYKLTLIDKEGGTEELTVYGIEKITKEITSFISPETVSSHFRDVDFQDVEQPLGSVDLLVGSDYAGFHPTVEQVNGHFVILSNRFGKCLKGRTSTNLRRDCAVVNLLQVESRFPCNEFLTIESLGVQCNPKCGGCRCGTCPPGGKQYTLKEERELKLIEDKLEFKGDHWEAAMPYIEDPNLIPDDYAYVLKRLKQNECRLAKDPAWNEVYNQKMEEFISRFARKLTRKEIKNYKGRTHYVSHHAVVQDSESTPVRIVWDSSHNFNEYVAKGPDAYMNELMSVCLQFRENHTAIAGDVRKMYNSISLKDSDQHMHRFFFRTDPNRAPNTYVITVVNMGDRPSGAIATVALRKTAQMGDQDFPEEAEIVQKSSYVDDITSSVNSSEDGHRISTNISKLLEPGNFFIKQWHISGEGEDISIKTLGIFWNTLKDSISFNIRLNFSKKVRNQHSGPDLTIEDIQNGAISSLCRRDAMSANNGVYDPYGLGVPVTVKGKMKMRKLWTLPGWDTPLDQTDLQQWCLYFIELLKLNTLVFPRSVKPEGANSTKPILVSFSDGSEEAFGCCVYVRWELLDGTFSSRLLASKSRVAPLKKTTVVRLELSAAVMAKRLRKTVEEAFKLEFACVIHILDSRIVKGMISKESYGFKTFAATRIGEIQTATTPEEWYWIESKLNIADIISRGATVEEIGPESEWFNGKVFMKLPMGQWPLRQDFPTDELPEQVKQVSTISLIENHTNTINIERFSSFVRLLRVTARIFMLVGQERSFKVMLNPISSNQLKEAEMYWVHQVQSQPSFASQLDNACNGKGNLRKLNIHKINGIYIAAGRIGAWNEFTFNKKELPVLSAKHKFSELYAMHIHNQAHRGPRADVAKIRTEYWVVGIQRLAKRIRHNCVDCRRLDGELQQQIMAPLPIERLKPAPMWHFTGVDLFGPFSVKGEVNKRSAGKGYGVIFTCLLTRAVYVDISCDYSTDAFLLVLRRFASIRGYPTKIFSDVGSQLEAASKELEEMFNDFDWPRIKAESVTKGFEWKFSPPEAPWYNGCCEALIRSIKKCIYHAIGNQVVSFSELQTTFFECANIINERPIGSTSSTLEDGSYICPNDMMLGRSTSKPPTGDFSLTVNSRRRIYFVQRLVDAFWKKWVSDYFPTLLERKKWHHSKRDQRVGDVVIIKDKDLKRSRWKLGLVEEAFSSSDGKVRRVSLKYINSAGSATHVKRPVQNLVLLLPVEGGESFDEECNGQ